MSWKLAWLVAMVLGLCCPLHAQLSQAAPDPATVRDLMQGIRSRLPKGWTLHYNAERCQIEAKRQGKKAQTQEPVIEGFCIIAMEVHPRISREEHLEQKRQYEESLRQLRTLEEKLGMQFGLWVRDKEGYYQSESAADKEMVDRYNALKDSLSEYSPGYWQNISAYMPKSFWSSYPEDQRLDEEARGVRMAFRFLLKEYF